MRPTVESMLAELGAIRRAEGKRILAEKVGKNCGLGMRLSFTS